jgi:hypothetical protein
MCFNLEVYTIPSTLINKVAIIWDESRINDRVAIVNYLEFPCERHIDNLIFPVNY